MAEVGILFSYDQEWALQIQPHHPELNYINHLKGYHKAFHNKNIPVDLLSDQDDFSRYKVLVAPLLYLMTPELAKKLESYVKNGGHLILTMRTGVKDWNNKVESRTLPGLLSDVLGIQIFDYDCLRDIKQSVKWKSDENVLLEEVKKWCDIITLDGAESLALYNQDFYENTPAITKNKFKNGLAYYVGTELQSEMMSQLVDHIVEHSQVKALLETPHDVEVTIRQKNNTKYLFVLNHNAESKTVEIPCNWKHIAGDNTFSESAFCLPAYGTAVFIEE
jgi:beta-galactosidase